MRSSLSWTQQLGSVNPLQQDHALPQHTPCLLINATSSSVNQAKAKSWRRPTQCYSRQRQLPLLPSEPSDPFSRLHPASKQQHILKACHRKGTAYSRSHVGEGLGNPCWWCASARFAKQTACKAGKQANAWHAKRAGGTSDGTAPGNLLIGGAIGATTELLRLLGVGGRTSKIALSESTPLSENPPLSSLDEVLEALRKDYTEQAYFVTGNITDVLYDRDCFFVDPTVKFVGRDKWKQNLKLLVPFLENLTITLLSMDQDEEQGKLVYFAGMLIRKQVNRIPLPKVAGRADLKPFVEGVRCPANYINVGAPGQLQVCSAGNKNTARIQMRAPYRPSFKRSSTSGSLLIARFKTHVSPRSVLSFRALQVAAPAYLSMQGLLSERTHNRRDTQQTISERLAHVAKNHQQNVQMN